MMNNSNNKRLWMLWLGLMTAVLIYLSNRLLDSNDKTIFMPGPLTEGHHQIEMACDACHLKSFDDKEAMLKTCIDCHDEERKKPFDSHPRQKFTDPRNAERLQKIDALNCITCHVEHQPDIAQKTGLTQPRDFCIHCHDDVAKERPSHKGMEFDSCASAGCHNFHNNRALYTDFLIKHQDEPEHLVKALLPEREFSSIVDEVVTYPHEQFPVRSLDLNDIDKPEDILSSNNINQDWLLSGHSKNGANCSSCHLQKQNDNESAIWVNHPDENSCTSCHEMEVKHFKRGKHGMRLKSGLSPMTPQMAILPMRDDNLDEELNCNACHPAHKYDVANAAIESCLGCHNDKHSLAYKDSKHYALWQAQQNGTAANNTGVSCASCHMPRISYDVSDWLNRVMVQHNQNANLVPNEKMIRSVCMQCHGLGFSIDSLADTKLIERNFKGQPDVHIQSIDLAKKVLLRHLKKQKDDE